MSALMQEQSGRLDGEAHARIFNEVVIPETHFVDASSQAHPKVQPSSCSQSESFH